MNILVVNCCPVRNGATAEIVKLVGQYVNDGNEVRTICIDDYDVRFCKGCRKCHETAKCFQEDDVIKIMKQYEWQIKPYPFLHRIGPIFRGNLKSLSTDVRRGAIHTSLTHPYPLEKRDIPLH